MIDAILFLSIKLGVSVLFRYHRHNESLNSTLHICTHHRTTGTRYDRIDYRVMFSISFAIQRYINLFADYLQPLPLAVLCTITWDFEPLSSLELFSWP